MLDGEFARSLAAQARAGGRGGAVARILDAMRTGFAHGAIGRRAPRGRPVCRGGRAIPAAGPQGIRAFLEKRSAPLPVRPITVPVLADAATRAALEREGRLLPIDASFFPGVTPIPEFQYAAAVIKDPATGLPAHGDPDGGRAAGGRLRCPRPGPNDALVYMLVSEINYNDIWAITGIPVSPFDARDVDVPHHRIGRRRPRRGARQRGEARGARGRR